MLWLTCTHLLQWDCRVVLTWRILTSALHLFSFRAFQKSRGETVWTCSPASSREVELQVLQQLVSPSLHSLCVWCAPSLLFRLSLLSLVCLKLLVEWTETTADVFKLLRERRERSLRAESWSQLRNLPLQVTSLNPPHQSPCSCLSLDGLDYLRFNFQIWTSACQIIFVTLISMFCLHRWASVHVLMVLSVAERSCSLCPVLCLCLASDCISSSPLNS